MDITIIVCVAVPILLLSLGMFVRSILFTLRAEKTTGTIVDFKTSSSSKSGVTQAEVVEFQLPDGKTIQFTEKSYRSRIILNYGKNVSVLYDPQNPTNAHINSFWTLYFVPVILLIIGLGLLIFNL